MSKQEIERQSTLNIREDLEKANKQFYGKQDIFGMTLLTNPGYVSSSRSMMFSSHLKQFTNLLKPEYPKVSTNFENMVGKYSTGYFKSDSRYKIVKKISKFDNDEYRNHIYYLLVYDEEKDYYDLIEKKNVENLTERFGYSYNTEVMDSKEEGDIIEKDEILYKSTSYDENNNYCYGKNIKFMYLVENNTIEDAIIASRSISNTLLSKEMELVKIPLNDNDIFCNLYGDNNTYKCFPDIGELCKNKVLASKRRIHKNQILYDLKKSNLRTINFTSDTPFYAEGRVTDINIFCNKPIDEIADNRFNRQILKYLKLQQKFYEDIYRECGKVINSGSKYSKDIGYLYKKAKEILDPDFKWIKEDNSIFNNMIIEILVEKDMGLHKGQKITGRSGNKGVISAIWEDEDMPFLENGEQVHLILNTLGVINRITSFPIFEQEITFICNRAIERMRTVDLKEKEKIFFTIIEIFNKEEYEALLQFYNNKYTTNDQKESFFERIMDKGIYIIVPPLWEDRPLIDKIIEVYKELPWIKPYQVYVNRFGRKIKMLRDVVVGEMYFMKLKQTSHKGFSVRSTGPINKKGLPDKSNKSKNHQELYSKTPIRIGEQENFNCLIGVNPEIMAELHNYYRSSIIARRELGEKLLTSVGEIEDLSPDEPIKNRNVEILLAYLKVIGLTIDFGEEHLLDISAYTDDINTYMRKGELFIGNREDYEDFDLRKEVEEDFRTKVCYVGFEDTIREKKEELYQKKKLLKNGITISREE